MDNFFIEKAHFTREGLENSLKSMNFRQLALFETCLHAFELLGRLAALDLPFLFKGGTSMFLHTDTPQRISTDIDIMTPVVGEGLVSLLREASEGNPFLQFDEQDRGFRGLPNRRHFRYFYRPVAGNGKPIPVLLDVVEDDFRLPEGRKTNCANVVHRHPRS